MTKVEVERALAEFLLTTFPNDGVDLTVSTPLLEEWFVDSLGILDVVFFLEQRFGVEVKRADINAETFESIATLADFVTRQQG